MLALPHDHSFGTRSCAWRRADASRGKAAVAGRAFHCVRRGCAPNSRQQPCCLGVRPARAVSSLPSTFGDPGFMPSSAFRSTGESRLKPSGVSLSRVPELFREPSETSSQVIVASRKPAANRYFRREFKSVADDGSQERVRLWIGQRLPDFRRGMRIISIQRNDRRRFHLCLPSLSSTSSAVILCFQYLLNTSSQSSTSESGRGSRW